MISLKKGLAYSLNQISAWVLKKFNPQSAVQMAKRMGITSKIEPYPSICVGAAEVSLEEMVAAYCVYANKGVYKKPVLVTRIEDRFGNVLGEFSTQKVKEAISEETAYVMLQMMRGVVDEGTSTRLKWRYGLKNPIAGKTGTTNDNSDGWFIGITPELVSGAWVGGEERSIRFRSTALGQGANMALPIWALYMKDIYKDKSLDYSSGPFEKPDALSIETDCNKYESDNGDKFPIDQ
ncbi:MAG: hypothetical protein C0594_07985 [Marinilabiliales bacterium]|nr:MAG: hypothetical protein C0594_07985 [Marinilabiliales bacterium]